MNPPWEREDGRYLAANAWRAGRAPATGGAGRRREPVSKKSAVSWFGCARRAPTSPRRGFRGPESPPGRIRPRTGQEINVGLDKNN
jgi:hypothetical protein